MSRLEDIKAVIGSKPQKYGPVNQNEPGGKSHAAITELMNAPDPANPLADRNEIPTVEVFHHVGHVDYIAVAAVGRAWLDNAFKMPTLDASNQQIIDGFKAAFHPTGIGAGTPTWQRLVAAFKRQQSDAEAAGLGTVTVDEVDRARHL